MKQELLATIAAVPNFVAYLVFCYLLSWLFVAIYIRFTPYREVSLIRGGNVAAALSLGGALLGFIASLSSVVVHSGGVVDLIFWSGIALVVQILTFTTLRFAIPEMVAGIEKGETAHGALLGIVSLGSGILCAACVTP